MLGIFNKKGLEGFFLASVLAGIVCLFVGCGSVGTQTEISNEDLKPARTNYEIIQPDDTLEITLILPTTSSTSPVPNQPVEQKVKSDGTINLYLIGDVKAAGKTPKDLETEIYNKYVPKYFTRATVTIRQTGRFFYVDGQVKMASRFQHVGEITVTGAIAAAGGFTDYANKKAVRIIRSDGKVLTLDYNKAIKNPKYDLPIYPGDRVIVPRRWM
ncbi:MAG: polysaccharide biosynthesis/export family protein [Verrucomicrobiae bacterium]|nr:polysaccharide biosynthesis/export family protein [Verrucomicrobiae bacterium]